MGTALALFVVDSTSYDDGAIEPILPFSDGNELGHFEASFLVVSRLDILESKCATVLTNDSVSKHSEEPAKFTFASAICSSYLWTIKLCM